MSVGIISNVISSYIHAYQARLYYMLDTLISILRPPPFIVYEAPHKPFLDI